MERGRPKSRVGVVKSNKMDKTVVVEVERRVRHGACLLHVAQQHGGERVPRRRARARETRSLQALRDHAARHAAL